MAELAQDFLTLIQSHAITAATAYTVVMGSTVLSHYLADPFVKQIDRATAAVDSVTTQLREEAESPNFASHTVGAAASSQLRGLFSKIRSDASGPRFYASEHMREALSKAHDAVTGPLAFGTTASSHARDAVSKVQSVGKHWQTSAPEPICEAVSKIQSAGSARLASPHIQEALSKARSVCAEPGSLGTAASSQVREALSKVYSAIAEKTSSVRKAASVLPTVRSVSTTYVTTTTTVVKPTPSDYHEMPHPRLKGLLGTHKFKPWQWFTSFFGSIYHSFLNSMDYIASYIAALGTWFSEILPEGFWNAWRTFHLYYKTGFWYPLKTTYYELKYQFKCGMRFILINTRWPGEHAAELLDALPAIVRWILFLSIFATVFMLGIRLMQQLDQPGGPLWNFADRFHGLPETVKQTANRIIVDMYDFARDPVRGVMNGVEKTEKLLIGIQNLVRESLKSLGQSIGHGIQEVWDHMPGFMHDYGDNSLDPTGVEGIYDSSDPDSPVTPHSPRTPVKRTSSLWSRFGFRSSRASDARSPNLASPPSTPIRSTRSSLLKPPSSTPIQTLVSESSRMPSSPTTSAAREREIRKKQQIKDMVAEIAELRKDLHIAKEQTKLLSSQAQKVEVAPLIDQLADQAVTINKLQDENEDLSQQLQDQKGSSDKSVADLMQEKEFLRVKNQYLKERWSKTLEEIKDIRQKSGDRERWVMELEVQKLKDDERIIALEAEKDGALREKDVFLNKLKETDDRVIDLTKELNDRTDKFGDLELENVKIREHSKEARDQFSTLERQIDIHNTNLKNLRLDKESLEKKGKESVNQLSTLKKDLVGRDSKVRNLEEENAKLQSQVTRGNDLTKTATEQQQKLQNEINDFPKHLEARDNTITRVSKEIEDITSSVGIRDNENETLRSRNSELKKQLKELEDRDEERSFVIRDIRKEMAGLKQEIKTLEARDRQRRKVVEDTETQITQLKNEKKMTEKKVKAFEKEKRDFETTKRSLEYSKDQLTIEEEKVKQLEIQKDALERRKNNEIAEKEARLTAEIDTARARGLVNDRSQEELQRLRENLDTLTKSRDEAIEAKAKYFREKVHLKHRNTEFEKEIREHETKNRELGERIDELEVTIRAIESERNQSRPQSISSIPRADTAPAVPAGPTRRKSLQIQIDKVMHLSHRPESLIPTPKSARSIRSFRSSITGNSRPVTPGSAVEPQTPGSVPQTPSSAPGDRASVETGSLETGSVNKEKKERKRDKFNPLNTFGLRKDSKRKSKGRKDEPGEGEGGGYHSS